MSIPFRKIYQSVTNRGSSTCLLLSAGFIFAGSQMLITYIAGAVFAIIGIIIFCYNWRHTTEDTIPSIAEAIRSSNVVWGFWHTGNRARQNLYYGSVKRILVLEPNPSSEAFRHVLSEVSGRPTTSNEIVTEIGLTQAEAKSKNIEIRWHNEITSQSFMICDPSAIVEGDKVTFSNRAFVVAQVLDRNVNIEEWAKYKKTKSKDRYAFEAYERWFKDVWETRCKPVS